MYKAGSPRTGAEGGTVGDRTGKNGSGWDLTSGFSSLLLPPASLLEGQVDDGAIGHVVVSQGVGILDENALILQLLFPCRHTRGFMNLHLDDGDLVCEREREDQHLSVQFPFSLILHVGHLDFDGHWTLVSA